MCNPRVTVDVVLHFSPPALQASLHKVQLLIGDAVRGRVRWGLNGWSALGERLVYGCPLTTGNQTLWRICVPWFTEEGRELIRKAWQKGYIIGSVTDEDFTWGKKKSVWDERRHAWDYFQPVVLADVFTERWATRSRWGWGQPQVFCRRNTARLGGGKLQHKLQHVRQRILGGAGAVVSVAVNRPRTHSKQYLLPQREEVYQVISHWKKLNKMSEVTIPVSAEGLQVAPWVFSLLLSFHWSA